MPKSRHRPKHKKALQGYREVRAEALATYAKTQPQEVAKGMFKAPEVEPEGGYELGVDPALPGEDKTVVIDSLPNLMPSGKPRRGPSRFIDQLSELRYMGDPLDRAQSMGANADRVQCSYCGAVAYGTHPDCGHFTQPPPCPIMPGTAETKFMVSMVDPAKAKPGDTYLLTNQDDPAKNGLYKVDKNGRPRRVRAKKEVADG